MNTRRAVALATCAIALTAHVARAEDELDAFKAKVEILGWLLPGLMMHGVLHEGSHALAARAVGAETVQIHVFPGHGAFAQTVWLKPNRTDGDVAFVQIAPQLTNVVTLTTYGILHEVGVPSNEHLRVPLTVLGLIAWSDLTVQLVPFPKSETEKLYRYLHLSTWQTVPLRAIHLGIVVLGYHYLTRGYDSIVDEPMTEAAPRLMVPLPFAF